MTRRIGRLLLLIIPLMGMLFSTSVASAHSRHWWRHHHWQHRYDGRYAYNYPRGRAYPRHYRYYDRRGNVYPYGPYSYREHHHDD